MRTSSVLVLGGLGVAGFLLWRYWQQQTQALAPGVRLDALTSGLQAGIDAGTYNAAALRNAIVTARGPGSA